MHLNTFSGPRVSKTWMKQWGLCSGPRARGNCRDFLQPWILTMDFNFIISIWVFSLHACLCTCTLVCVEPMDARRGSRNFLELEVQIVVSHLVVAGNQTQIPLEEQLVHLNHGAISWASFYRLLSILINPVSGQPLSLRAFVSTQVLTGRSDFYRGHEREKQVNKV